MTANDRPTFDARDVVAIASQLEPDDEAFVIGGQALNIWVTYFHQMAPDEFGPKEYYTSEDIDYYGSRAAVQGIAGALDGKFRFPDADDHTPNTGQVVTELGGKNLTIDFLGTVLGIKDPELRNGVSVIEIEAALDNRRVVVKLKLLHPVLPPALRPDHS